MVFRSAEASDARASFAEEYKRSGMKNFHLPLPDRTLAELRAAAKGAPRCPRGLRENGTYRFRPWPAVGVGRDRAPGEDDWGL